MDAFTRKAFAEPVKDKKAPTIAKAFQKIFNDNQIKPKSIYRDHGNEWKGEFAELMKTLDIVSLENDLEDRFSKTIKSTISKYMVANNTGTCINVLPELTKLYNETPHSSIDDIKPSEADDTMENIIDITRLNSDKRDQNKKINK